MDSSGDCSYTTNGASLPQAQMTSVDRRAAEANAAETPTMLKTAHMAGKQYGRVKHLPPYTPTNSD